MRPPEAEPRLRISGGAVVLGATALLVLATAAVPAPVLVDAATGLGVTDAVRVTPPAWLAFAPLFGVWDTLSLLTLSQHVAVLVTLVAFYLSWRTRRAGASTMLREFGTALAALVLLLSFYVAGVILPRPMTGIDLRGSDDRLTIDFHSHTRWSHDGWRLFTSARNRAWHERGGFDAAYVTDHYTWRGFDEAAPENPATAGEGLVLLEGAEIRIHRRPTNILGDRSRYAFALDEDSVFMDPERIAARYAADPDTPPTLLYTMPGRLIRVVPFSDSVPSGMIGIEINDGSPRGLEQVRAERAEILALADSMDLALIGAANLHGWGRTVASWSVMRIPGWHGMRPEELGGAIERVLHRDRRQAVRVIERRMPYHDGAPARVALTLPLVVVEHARMMSWPERASWLVWLSLAGLLTIASRRRAAVRRGR